MLWVKISNYYKKHENNLLLIGFIVLFLITRIPNLSTDVINPDGVNWHYRTEQFINGIKYFQFEKTYQHYHPGVTLMWITGIPIEIAKIVTGQKVYSNSSFLMFEGVAKYSLVTVQLLLSLFTLFLFTKSKQLTFKTSILILSLFTFEPFFIGNSRLYHLDVLLTLFVLNALVLSYLFINEIPLGNMKNKYVGIMSGLFLGLSFLTKSIGIGAFVFVLIYLISLNILKTLEHTATKKYFYEMLGKFVILVLSFIFFTFLFFPALWKDPIFYLTEIFSESERVGVRKGHEQIIFGEVTTDGGLFFYPLVLLIKLSPFILIGFLLNILRTLFGLINDIRRKNIFPKERAFKIFRFLHEYLSSFNWFLCIFYLGYFLVMLFPTKKIDRYMIFLYPVIAYYSYFGYQYLLKYFSKRMKNTIKLYGLFKALIFVLYFVSVLYPMFSFFPYYFTYYSPVFINAQNAHNIIAQKPFGVGIYELKDYIISNYGDVRLGFIDTKPIETIYPSSKVFDIRVESTGKYDLLVLGPNEDLPEKVLDSNIKFTKDNSIYINGLEYWRIYVKEKVY